MDEAIENKFNELIKEIDSIPAPQREKLNMLVGQTYDRHKQLRKDVDELHESLDYLRVSLKYLLFDLEATRRENAQLKGLLKDGIQ